MDHTETVIAEPSGRAVSELPNEGSPSIIGADDLILVTGASGFIGSEVVRNLVMRGFRNLRCFTRSAKGADDVRAVTGPYGGTIRCEVVRGNLLSKQDCDHAAKDAKVIFHLAAGRGEKSYADAFANSVVTTRNLLEAASSQSSLLRFVNVSSFAVYSNRNKPRRNVLDESCPVEIEPHLRGEAYCFAKVKQDELVTSYCEKQGIPYVIVRPGYVYGPAKAAITDRIGIDTFGVFLHCGGANPIPLTYVDNCADAIVQCGLRRGLDGEVFNVVDDDLPSSRGFLRLYKRHVTNFRSYYVPHAVSYALCYLWEKYSISSEGQLPPAFNRRRWFAYWKKTSYSNEKLRKYVNLRQAIATPEALQRYFEGARRLQGHA